MINMSVALSVYKSMSNASKSIQIMVKTANLIPKTKHLILIASRANFRFFDLPKTTWLQFRPSHAPLLHSTRNTKILRASAFLSMEGDNRDFTYKCGPNVSI